MTRQGFITHEKGSWKWQDRFELAEYKAVWGKRAKKFLWKKVYSIDTKVKPNQCGDLFGGHNTPLTEEEVKELLYEVN